MGVQKGGLAVPVLARRLPAKTVDCSVAGSRDDPALRARRHPGGRPALHRSRECLLDRLFGDVDVTELADQGSDGTTVRLAESTLDFRGGEGWHGRSQSSASPWNGRTSIGRVVASAYLRAHASAESKSGTLMMVTPPMCSLPSASGPSVKRTSLPLSRTTVAV